VDETFDITVSDFSPIYLYESPDIVDFTFNHKTDSEVTMTFGEYTSNYEGDLDITYTVERSNGNPIPEYVTFDEATRTFTVEGAGASDLGDYEILIKADDSKEGAFNHDAIFVLTIDDEVENAAPEFATRMADGSLYVLETLVYILPSYIDEDTGDTHEYTFESDGSGFMTLDTGAQTLTVEPTDAG
jgi:hypothetical protein